MAEEILYVTANLDQINAQLDELDKNLKKVGKTAEQVGDEIADAGGGNTYTEAGQKMKIASAESEKLAKSQKDAAKASKELSTSTKQATINLTDQNKKATSLTGTFSKLGIAISGAFAAKKIIEFGAASIKVAQEVRGVALAFDKLNQPGLLSELRSATQGAVSDLELMKASVNAQNLGVPIEKLGVLFEFASQRAAETGQNVQQLVSDIVGGLGGKSTRILDNLGISAIDLKKGLDGISLGSATVEQLTNSLAKTIEGQLDPAFRGAVSSTDKFNAVMDNLQAKVGEALLPAFDETVDILSAIGGALLGIDFNETFDPSLIEGFNDELQQVTANLLANNAAALANVSTYGDFQKEQEGLAYATRNANILLSESVEELSAFLDNQKTAFIGAGQESETYKNFLASVQERLDSLTKDTDESTKSTLGIIEALKEQLKVTDELIQKAQSQAEINQLLTRREEIEARINEILNDRFKVQQTVGDQLVNITQQFLDSSDDILKSFEEQAQAARGLEQIADESYERDLQNKIEATEKKKQDDQDYADFQLGLLRSQEEAALTSASYLFGQLNTLYSDNAEAQKLFASFDALIRAYQAINVALTAGPIAGPILAASIGALALANVAKINSTPVPQYFEGTANLQLGRNKKGRDTIPVMAHEGEAIIPTRRNKQYPGLSAAMIAGKVDEYISAQQVRNAVVKVQQDRRIMELKMGGNTIADLNDARIVNELRKTRKANELMIELLATQRLKSNPYRL